MREEVTFGQWVRQRRRALDLTQAELAQRMSYSTITIRRVESGTRRPSKQLVELLAHHLGIQDEERVAFTKLGRSLLGPGPQTTSHLLSWSRRAVPSPLSEMVGRTAEQQRVLQALRTGSRLVAITGPGGVGKTRLAASVAHVAAGDFDQTCWIPLSEVSDSSTVVPAVTEALGLGVREGDILTASTRHLQRHRCLVVLDSLEHLVESSVALTGLLQAVPDVSMLITTRTALRVPGEVQVELAPMAVPDSADWSEAGVRRSPAVRLFRDSARRVQPQFEVTEQTWPAVHCICRQVDGLPLGLEMAAGNLNVLSVEDLAARLSAGDWPEPRWRSPPRHRTLQAVMDTSSSLLSSPAELVLARAAVFVGQWSLRAAEAVCADDRVADGGMLSIHAELRNHSMITVDTQGGSTRYAMLGTVRRYALERWSAPALREEAERRHTAFFARLASEACSLLVTSHQVACLELITQELGNFRAAIDRATAGGAETADPELAELALLTTARLERFWSTTGRSGEGIRRLRAALDVPAAHGHACASARGEALGALSVLEMMQHHFDRAREAAEKMHQLAERRDDTKQVCVAIRNLGTIAVLEGDSEEGTRQLRACLDVAGRTPGTAHVTAWALSLLGSSALLGNDLDAAEHWYDAALPRLRDLGDLNFLALTLRRKAQVNLALQRTEAVIPLVHESLRYNISLRSPAGIAACLVVLADTALAGGRSGAAAEALGRAEALLDISGERLTRPDQDQHDRCRAAVEQQLGLRTTLRLLHSGGRTPWEQEGLRSWPEPPTRPVEPAPGAEDVP